MKNVYGKDINDNTRLTRHYQDWEVELAKPNKDYITTDYFCPKRDVSYDDCLNKLGPLEDFEDELGIGLLSLIKALKNGIYVKNRKNEIRRVSCNIGLVETGGHNSLGLRFQDTNYKWRYLVLDTSRDNDIKDYGKTWALTKEELE